MGKVQRNKPPRIYMKRGQQIVYAERGVRFGTGVPRQAPGEPSGKCLGPLKTKECRCGKHNKENK